MITGLLTSAFITGRVSIAVFANGAVLLAGIALSEPSQLFSPVTAIAQRYFKIFIVNQGKHVVINLIAQRKLYSIADILSQAMQGRHILSIEFERVLQGVEKYQKLQSDIRNQAKTKAEQITKQKRKEMLKQGRKKDKKDFL